MKFEVLEDNKHYAKSVIGINYIDVYRVLQLFEVTDPCIAHSIKKLLCAGQRNGGKSKHQDVLEALQSLDRWLDIQAEDSQR